MAGPDSAGKPAKLAGANNADRATEVVGTGKDCRAGEDKQCR